MKMLKMVGMVKTVGMVEMVEKRGNCFQIGGFKHDPNF